MVRSAVAQTSGSAPATAPDTPSVAPGSFGDIPLLADKPDRVIELPDAEWVDSIAFLPDGKSLIVHMQVRAINVWELIHHYWPEEIGALLAIAVLVLVRAAVHVRMRPQRRGEPHCRGCGYCLTGVAPGPCPECGLDKRAGTNDKGRVIGRSALRRLRWAIVPVLVVGGVYGGLFAAGVGRWSRAYDAFEWWSISLNRIAKEHDVAWLLARGEVVTSDVTIGPSPSTSTVRWSNTTHYSPLPRGRSRFSLTIASNEVDSRSVVYVENASSSGRGLIRLVQGESSRLFGVLDFTPGSTPTSLLISPDGCRLLIAITEVRQSSGAINLAYKISEYSLPPP